MSVRVFINGSITSGEDACISVFDRGFLYGDSVYEVLRTSNGKPVDLERHLERLGRSANALVLSLPTSATVRHAIADTLAAAANPESYIRVVITRGAGEVGLDTALAETISFLVIVKPMVLPKSELYESGVSVRLVGVQRTSVKSVDPAVKSGNYLNNILALAEARKHDDYEAVMCDQAGWLAEGSSSNVFLVKQGVLRTPSPAVGLLSGITRQRVLELATGEGMEVEEALIAPAALREADEAFLTSSIRGIIPVTRVDSEPVGDGMPGPVTGQLMSQYAAFLASEGTSA